MANITLLDRQLITKISNSHGLDPLHIAAFILTESGGNTWAVRFEPGWRFHKDEQTYAKALGISVATELDCQQISWGLMQVMGTVAREQGYSDHLAKLCMPEIGIEIGCRKVASLFHRYKTWDEVVSAFNCGSVVVVSGHYSNQEYVDKHNKFLKDVTAAWKNTPV